MKLTKQANGKKTIKMSQSEWEDVGKKAGWINKEAEENGLPNANPTGVAPTGVAPTGLPNANPTGDGKEVVEEDIDNLSTRDIISSKLYQSIMTAKLGTGIPTGKLMDFVTQLFAQMKGRNVPISHIAKVMKVIHEQENRG